jgi:hypothetical protein
MEILESSVSSSPLKWALSQVLKTVSSNIIYRNTCLWVGLVWGWVLHKCLQGVNNQHYTKIAQLRDLYTVQMSVMISMQFYGSRTDAHTHFREVTWSRLPGFGLGVFLASLTWWCLTDNLVLTNKKEINKFRCHSNLNMMQIHQKPL